MQYEDRAPAVRSESGLAILYDQLSAPKSAVEAIAEKRPFGLAIFVLILSVISKVAAGLIVPSNAGVFSDISLFILLCFAQIVITAVFTILAASVYHFAATNEYKLGDVRVLFILISVCLLPDVFSAPIALILNWLPWANTESLWFVSLVTLWIWGVVLQIIAVKNYYSISAGRSLFAVILPFILLSALGMGGFLLVFTYLMSSIKALVG